MYAIPILILAALFAAMDQVIRYPQRFLPISRLPVSFYRWDLKIKWLAFLKADKFYQGAKMWCMALSWFVAPWDSWFIFFAIMALWWILLRNFILHTLITRDVRILGNSPSCPKCGDRLRQVDREGVWFWCVKCAWPIHRLELLEK